MSEVSRDPGQSSDHGESPQEPSPNRIANAGCSDREDLYQSPFALWLTAALRKSGKTQKDLANHLGVNDSAVSRLKHGKRRLLADELSRISDYLSVAPPTFAVDGEQRTHGMATSEADAKLARIRAMVEPDALADEVEKVRKLDEQDRQLRQLLGLSSIHDVVESVRFLYEHGREAFEKRRGPRSSNY